MLMKSNIIMMNESKAIEHQMMNNIYTQHERQARAYTKVSKCSKELIIIGNVDSPLLDIRRDFR